MSNIIYNIFLLSYIDASGDGLCSWLFTEAGLMLGRHIRALSRLVGFPTFWLRKFCAGNLPHVFRKKEDNLLLSSSVRERETSRLSFEQRKTIICSLPQFWRETKMVVFQTKEDSLLLSSSVWEREKIDCPLKKEDNLLLSSLLPSSVRKKTSSEQSRLSSERHDATGVASKQRIKKYMKYKIFIFLLFRNIGKDLTTAEGGLRIVCVGSVSST